MTYDSSVQYEGTVLADFYVKFRPVVPEQVVDRIIAFLKLKYDGGLNLAIDVGCGSGQGTELLAQHFSKVIGTDVSTSQVDVARTTSRHSNVVYKVCPAERCPAVEDGSVQLISSSMAAHWFDLPEFFKEVDRLLYHKGTVAISGYDPVNYFQDYDPPTSEELRSALEDLYITRLGGYWASNIPNILNVEYRNIIIPYEETVREEVWVDEPRTLADLIGYVQSWCGYRNYCETNGRNGGQALLDELKERIQKSLNMQDRTPEEINLKTKRKYFILLGRKN